MQKAVIDYTDNPELTNYALSKSAGDTVEITFKGKFESSDGGKLSFNIEEVEMEYDGEDTEVEPSLEEPVALEVFAVSDAEAASTEKGSKTAGDGDESLFEDEEEDVN